MRYANIQKNWQDLNGRNDKYLFQSRAHIVLNRQASNRSLHALQPKSLQHVYLERQAYDQERKKYIIIIGTFKELKIHFTLKDLIGNQWPQVYRQLMWL